MLLTDNDEAVTFICCKFVVSRHTLLSETHPHRLLTGLHTGLSGHLLTRRLPRVLGLWPLMVGEDVLALLE